MNKDWFEYRLRVNPRARYVRLRVSVERGLEVIVPIGYDPNQIPTLLEQKRGWIFTALERAEANRRLLGNELLWRLPNEIAFPSIGRIWDVAARESAQSRVAVREPRPGQVLIHGRLSDEDACRAALGRWLVRQAHQYLVPMLRELSGELGFSFRRAYVRRQRTRWGSCSSRKTITLNAKLLFLPPALVRHVMVHELCHLVEMNHSTRFWRLVKQHDPEFRSHGKLLRDAGRMVPGWAS